jgi:DNA-binding NarL/FixJ family response regulator
VSNDLYEGHAGPLVRAVPISVVPFRLDVPDGSTPWRTLLERVTLLSTRDTEVLLLLGTGASNRSIANRLNVTERTVKAHVAQVMAKLVVESRLQAGLVSLVFQMTREVDAR